VSSRNWGRNACRSWLALLIVLLYAPILVVLGASLDRGPDLGPAAFLRFPPQDVTLHWYTRINPAMWDSVWFSVRLAAATAAAALALGVPAALGLARVGARAYRALGTLFRVPLQIPYIVTGVAFLQAYHALAVASGLQFAGTFPGLFFAHLLVATPYVVSATLAALGGAAIRIEDAALSLGASFPRALWRVTLPLAMPGIFAGGLYAFLVSFTDVTVSVLLGGVGTVTFPVAIMNAIGGELDPALPAIASLVFLLSVGAVLLLQRLLGLRALLASSRHGG
jgi:putative spermidine/putrescine transport system permease protein